MHSCLCMHAYIPCTLTQICAGVHVHIHTWKTNALSEHVRGRGPVFPTNELKSKMHRWLDAGEKSPTDTVLQSLNSRTETRSKQVKKSDQFSRMWQRCLRGLLRQKPSGGARAHRQSVAARKSRHLRSLRALGNRIHDAKGAPRSGPRQQTY